MEIDYSKLRYILDEDGYICHASIGGLIVCDLGQCTEYKGTIPEGYETIAEWYDNEIEKLNAWKVIEGNLVFDENKYKELQNKWEKEAEENSLSTHSWVKNQIHKSNSVVVDELSNNVKGSSLVVLKDSGNYEIPNVSISGNVDEVKVISSNRNILGINAITKTIDGVTFDINSDGSITLNGVATKDIEFDLNGTNSNQEMLFLLKNNTDYMISGLTDNVSLYLYNFDGTDRTLIESCQNGLLNYSNSYKVTYVTLFIKNGRKFSNVTLYPQLELSNYVSEFIKHEENVVNATLFEKEATITTLTSYDPLTIVMVDEDVNINVDYYKYKSIEEQLAKIENNIENILLSVSNKVDYSNTIKNRDYIHITNNNDNYPSLFKIKGDLHTLYPQEDLYPSDDLFPDDASYSEENEQYKYVSLVIDKEETPTEDIIRILLPLNYLNKFEDTYDEFIVENGVCSIIRRIGVNEYGSKYVLDEAVKEDRGTLDIPLFNGTNYIYLEDYRTEGLTFEITYAIRNEYTDEIANIKIQSDTIEQEVKKKVNATDYTGASIVLKINEDESEAKINADKITLSANDILNLIAGNEINLTSKNITIKSNNFSVDKDGNITAKSGKIAGYSILNNTLKGANVGMCGVAGEEYAFWAGADTGHDAPFRVGHGGDLRCSNVRITGGTIEGVDIYLSGTQDAQKMIIAYSGDPYNYHFVNMSYGFKCKYGGSNVSLIPMGDYHAFELSHGDKLTYIDCTGVITPKISVGNMDCGQGTCNSDGYRWVSFNKTFPSIPRVVATPNTSTNGVIAVKIRNVSTTGFEATLGGTNFGNETFDWIAMSN